MCECMIKSIIDTLRSYTDHSRSKHIGRLYAYIDGEIHVYMAECGKELRIPPFQAMWVPRLGNFLLTRISIR